MSHAAACAALDELASGPELVTLFSSIVMADLRVATHPSILASPLSMDEALANVEQLLARPHIRTASEGAAYWTCFRGVADGARRPATWSPTRTWPR